LTRARRWDALCKLDLLCRTRRQQKKQYQQYQQHQQQKQQQQGESKGLLLLRDGRSLLDRRRWRSTSRLLAGAEVVGGGRREELERTVLRSGFRRGTADGERFQTVVMRVRVGAW
jgi:hypothetical protein